MVALLLMAARSRGSISSFTTAAGDVSVAFDGPEDGAAVVLLAPGAGGGMDGAFMRAVARGVGERDLEVCRFNFAYTEQGRRTPDKQAVLEQTYRDVVASVRSLAVGRPLFLGGKSMGGRIASHIVAEGEAATGLVFLGYPLHPPGRPERIRDQHLDQIEIPMLFVEGTRDPFCPLATLEGVRARLRAETSLVRIHDGDHSFKVRRGSGRSTDAAWQEVVAAVVDWVSTVMA